jgi:hypothetical protein
MTTRLTFVLSTLILAAIALDQTMDWGAGLFLARKALDFLDFVMFWR